jgi:hypothetical protein
MRVWIAVVSIVLVIGTAVGTAAAAGSRLTFQCADALQAPPCDGRFVMNGAPRFLLGVYDSGFLSPPADGWENALFTGSGDPRYYRGLGGLHINAYLNYWQGMDTIDQLINPVSGVTRGLLDILDDHAVMWWQTANCSGDGSYTRYSPGFSVDRDNGFFAGRLATHRAMAGYYIMDECGDYGYGTNLVPETQRHHGLLKSYDGAAVNLAVPVARGYRDPLYWLDPPYLDPTNPNPDPTRPTADLFGTDPYPMYGSEGRSGYPQFEVADYIARLREDVSSLRSAEPASMPIVAVLQFFKFGGGGRLPNRSEMRMHAYSAIVEGAQGLFWWDIGENGIRNRNVKNNELGTALQNLKDLVNEINTLESALLATPKPATLNVAAGLAFTSAVAWRIDAVTNDIPLISNYADKQWYQAELNALKQSPPNLALSPMLLQDAPQKSYIRTRVTFVGNVGYVIAYNYGKTAVKGATFTWQSSSPDLPWASAPASVTVVGESRTLAPSGWAFKDDFGPYEAHVYKIQP